MQPLNPTALSDLALYCAKAGDESCALEHIVTVVEMQPTNAEFLLLRAEIHCLFGEDEECLDWLGRAVNLGISPIQIEMVPQFSRLRGDPRFKKIFESLP